MAVYLFKHDPSLLQKRMNFDIPKKLWDKFAMLSIVIFGTALFIMPALDVRYGWSTVPLFVKTIAFLAIIWGLYIIFLTLKENTYLAKIVVIQKDHKVVTTGPYAKVRHPMYVAAITLFIALPLALDSRCSLIVGLILACTLIVRTSLEDKMLQKELKGYKAYTKKVKYKLLPGVW
jgi:protein-S-isoprenylcysteine O-methyltransferase Ste14